MKRLKNASLVRKTCSSMLLLGLSVLGISTQIYAQTRIDGDPVVIETRGPSDNRGRDRGNANGEGRGGRSPAPADPHPALTAATNAYQLALATWQNAYQKHQTAVDALARARMRASMGYSAVALIAAAVAESNEYDARVELENAEKRRNEAEKVARDATKEVLAREAARQKIEADAKKAMRQDYQERKDPAGGNRDRH